MLWASNGAENYECDRHQDVSARGNMSSLLIMFVKMKISMDFVNISQYCRIMPISCLFYKIMIIIQ